MAMPQCCYLAKGAKRPSHTTNTIKFDRIPFDPCNSIKRFDLCPFDQKKSTYLQPPDVDNHKSEVCLSGVLYVPYLGKNFLSISALDGKGATVSFENVLCILSSSGHIVGTARKNNGLYKVKVEPITQANVAMNEQSIPFWHSRMGHVSKDVIRQLPGGKSVTGVKKIQVADSCQPCADGKQYRLPFPRAGQHRAWEVLQRIHIDVCGPVEQVSIGGSRYFVTFVDDYSRLVFVYFLKAKLEVFEKFRQFVALVENHTGKTVRILRSDRGKTSPESSSCSVHRKALTRN